MVYTSKSKLQRALLERERLRPETFYFTPCPGPGDRLPRMRYPRNGIKTPPGERDFSGTPNLPVYVMLPLGIINMECELVDHDDELSKQLKTLKSVNADGVTVNIWWGIVEANNPQQYNWKGYKELFRIVCQSNLCLQVVISFHDCGAKGDDVHIPLPKWITEIGIENPDIYFTCRCGRRNHRTLTWGIDEEPVLGGRTAVEVYYQFMRSFRDEFDEFFKDGSIAEIELGLGACGELRYPSCPANHDCEFQCHDKYLRKCLEIAVADAGEDSSWGRPPQDTTSFHDEDYDSAYGFFFLNWYSWCLVGHGDRVLLAMASLAFGDVLLAVKLSGMHWWSRTASDAAELAAGFCDGYEAIASMLKKHETSLNFTCIELRTLDLDQVMDPKGLVWEVVDAAWLRYLQISGENTVECYGRDGYNMILELAKPSNDRYDRHLSSFTYRGLTKALFEPNNLREFQLFIQKMHGEDEKGGIVKQGEDTKLKGIKLG